MASGDITLTNHGMFDVTGASIKTLFDSLALTSRKYASGASVYFVPMADCRQVQIFSSQVAT